MDKTWDKLHQPCPLCNSSDAVGINEDDSAKCFSCGEFMPSYTDACGGKDMQTATTTREQKLPRVLPRDWEPTTATTILSSIPNCGFSVGFGRQCI